MGETPPFIIDGACVEYKSREKAVFGFLTKQMSCAGIDLLKCRLDNKNKATLSTMCHAKNDTKTLESP